MRVVDFRDVKVGDTVTRMLGGQGGVEMQLTVTKVDEKLIYCGFADPAQAWTFDRATGIEEDPDLGWGVESGVTGSYLIP